MMVQSSQLRFLELSILGYLHEKAYKLKIGGDPVWAQGSVFTAPFL